MSEFRQAIALLNAKIYSLVNSHHKTADFKHELLIMLKKNMERVFYALIEKYRKEGRFIFIESLRDLTKTH